MDVKPISAWMKPCVLPVIEKYTLKTFWVAVKSIRTDRNGSKVEKKYVFPAQYVNKPVNFDDNGDADYDDHFTNEDGEPMSAVGWFSEMEHAGFDGYYSPLPFSDEYILLGWAEYLTPEFNH